jgi:hypothetical protein
MTEFTIDDLAQLLRECGGEDESPDWDGAVADESFEDQQAGPSRWPPSR